MIRWSAYHYKYTVSQSVLLYSMQRTSSLKCTHFNLIAHIQNLTMYVNDRPTDKLVDRPARFTDAPCCARENSFLLIGKEKKFAQRRKFCFKLKCIREGGGSPLHSYIGMKTYIWVVFNTKS